MDNTDTDIRDLFATLLQQHGSIDVADSELKKLLAEDHDLKNEYREWCDNEGVTEAKGFALYCEEYFDSIEERFEVLDNDDYDG